MEPTRTTVQALHVNARHIYFICPHCWTNKSVTKTYDSNVYKNRHAISRKPKIHCHSNEESGPRAIGTFTHRSHHDCSEAQRKDPLIKKGVVILFTENTRGLVYDPIADE